MFEFTVPQAGAPRSSRTIALSVAFHGLLFALLLALRFSTQAKLPVAPRMVTFLAPVKEMPVLPVKVRLPRLPKFVAPPITRAQLELPLVALISAPPMEAPKPVLPEMPRTPLAIAVPKVSGFTEAQVVPAIPTVAAKPIVKIAGFQSSETAANNSLRSLSSTVGAFDSAPATGAVQARGPLANMRAGGFSETTAAASGAPRGGAIKNGMFGDTSIDKGAAQKQAARPSSSGSTAVEILSKPRPGYTEEARLKNIEGEVLLEMQFSAAGEARVLRMVRGLGHGLDENAIAAARGIRFRPATREGQSVDSSAVVHILFQLAN